MHLFAGLLSPRSENMSLQEVTLERITKSNTHMVMVVLRPVYHEMKQLPGKDKGTWWKSIVRLVDQKGQGLYAEIRGSSESGVRKRAQEFYQPKYIQLTQAVVVQNSLFFVRFLCRCHEQGQGVAGGRGSCQCDEVARPFPHRQVQLWCFGGTFRRKGEGGCHWKGDPEGDAHDESPKDDIVAEG